MYILSIFVSIAKNTYQKPVQFGANKTIGFYIVAKRPCHHESQQ